MSTNILNVTSERYKICSSDGNKFEELFKNKVLEKKLNYSKSDNKDDWYNHIDCYVNGYGVDVKGNRHINTIWLEYTNVNGNLGWLRGKAKYIAMHIFELDCFSIYLRKDLLKYVNENVFETTENKNDYLKFYTRKKWGKKDMVVKVRYNDIKHLEINKL